MKGIIRKKTKRSWSNKIENSRKRTAIKSHSREKNSWEKAAREIKKRRNREVTLVVDNSYKRRGLESR